MGAYTFTRPVYDFVLSDTLAFVGLGPVPATVTGPDDALTVLAIVNPAAPQKIGGFGGPNGVADLAVHGQHAFLNYQISDNQGGYASGYRVVDFSNLANMIEVASNSPLDWIYDLAVQGDFLFATGNLSGVGSILAVFDPSNPAAPLPRLDELVLDDPGNLTLQGDVALVNTDSSDKNRVTVVDISNETSLSATNGYGGSSSAGISGFQTQNGLLLVAYTRDGLHLVDLNQGPAQQISRLDDLSSVRNLRVVSDSLYVLDSYDGLAILDISQRDAPQHTGFYSDTRQFQDLDIEGDYAYLLGQGLTIVDVADPTNPVLAARYSNIFAPPGQIEVDGGYAYIANREAGSNQLEILDLSATPSIMPVGDYSSGNYATGLDVRGNEVFLAESNFMFPATVGRVVKLDVSDPNQPQVAGIYTSTSYLYQVATLGDTVYTLSNDALFVLDFQNPLAPTLVTTRPISSGQRNDLVVDSSKLFVSTADGLLVFDLTNPSAPVETDRYPQHYDSLWTARKVDNYVYLAGGRNGVTLLKFGDPDFATYLPLLQNP